MMRKAMTDDNWGEQRLAVRKRRRGMIRAAMVTVAIAFGILAPRLIPDGPGAAETKLIAALVYAAVIAAGGWFAWSYADEIERRIAINAFAATGFATLFLGVLVMVAVPVFGIAYPLTTVWTLALAVGGVTWAIQRLRK